jgi:hypothetical protein
VRDRTRAVAAPQQSSLMFYRKPVGVWGRVEPPSVEHVAVSVWYACRHKFRHNEILARSYSAFTFVHRGRFWGASAASRAQSQSGVSGTVRGLLHHCGGHVLVESHPLNALPIRPKLLALFDQSEQKTNMLCFANGRRPKTGARNHGSDSCEPAHADGRRPVRDSAGQPTDGQAD